MRPSTAASRATAPESPQAGAFHKETFSIMKIVAFALGATQAFALLHRFHVANSTARVNTAAKVHTNRQARIDPDALTKSEERKARRDYNDALKKAESDNEIEVARLNGTCAGNTMRCVYVHELPGNFCVKTHQPNWCVDYEGKPACIMVKNYDLYVGTLMEEGETEADARGKLSGDHHDLQCAGTRGWGKPANLDGDTLPSCKSAEEVGRCDGHFDGKKYDCPSCGNKKGQDGGAAADNDVIGVGGGVR